MLCYAILCHTENQAKGKSMIPHSLKVGIYQNIQNWLAKKALALAKKQKSCSLLSSVASLMILSSYANTLGLINCETLDF